MAHVTHSVYTPQSRSSSAWICVSYSRLEAEAFTASAMPSMGQPEQGPMVFHGNLHLRMMAWKPQGVTIDTPVRRKVGVTENHPDARQLQFTVEVQRLPTIANVLQVSGRGKSRGLTASFNVLLRRVCVYTMVVCKWLCPSSSWMVRMS